MFFLLRLLISAGYVALSIRAKRTWKPPSRRSRWILQHSEFIITKQILEKIVGPAARHSVSSVYSVD
jgi:hypothetical protein